MNIMRDNTVLLFASLDNFMVNPYKKGLFL